MNDLRDENERLKRKIAELEVTVLRLRTEFEVLRDFRSGDHGEPRKRSCGDQYGLIGGLFS